MIRFRFKTCRSCNWLIRYEQPLTIGFVLACKCIYLPRLDISKED